MGAIEELEALRNRQRLIQADFEKKMKWAIERHQARMTKLFKKELPLIKRINWKSQHGTKADE